MSTDQPTEGRIAISEDRRLAIFGSPFGFAGPVIQQYEPFTDETQAIKEARHKIGRMGLPIHHEISRPRLTRMVMTTSKPHKPKGTH